MKLHRFAALLVFATASMAAKSTTIDIGTLPLLPADYSLDYTTQGTFSDIFNFTAPSVPATARGSANEVRTLDYALSDINLSLYTSGNVLVLSGIPIAIGGTVTASVLADAPLTAGADYYFKVTGATAGALGGRISFFVAAQPVPEPNTCALMLAGVAVVGSVNLGRRGNRRVDGRQRKDGALA